MIWRVRDRSTFEELRRHGRRVREGPVTVTFVPNPTAGPPRVAFAVGRAVGTAVARNRARRRLRAIVRELGGQLDGGLGPGSYLVGLGGAGAALPYVELKASVGRALRALHHSEARPGRPAGPTP